MRASAWHPERLTWPAFPGAMLKCAPKSSYKSRNSARHLASASRAARFGFGGNMASISSFHRTACSKLICPSCGALPLQSGNSNPPASCNCPSFGGGGASEFFIEFLVAMLENGRPKFWFIQVQMVDDRQLNQILQIGR